jgi:3-methylcrotonyl-CoA carboxylase alpha subunit
VRPGETVARGAVLAIVEAMKMEHAVTAPRDGIVEAVHFAAGDLVPEGAELLTLEPAPGEKTS